VKKQPWIYKPLPDLVFICLPAFFCVAALLLFPNIINGDISVEGWWWVVLVLGIDVSHVYTTLYRTYFDKTVLSGQKTLLTIIPVIAFTSAFLLYSLGSDIFWRLLAYIAVFHFVRQQYGFVKVYNRQEPKDRNQKIDNLAVYAATVYPLIYWHCYGPFEFNWFVKDDFMMWRQPVIERVAFVGYLICMTLYVIKEMRQFIRTRFFNWPKNLIILGTALSWYLGIVYCHSDLGFTLFNVVTHGIPYMALVWMYGRRQVRESAPGYTSGWMKRAFTGAGVVLFLIVPLVLGFAEEGLWDAWIWNEQREVFGWFRAIHFELSAELKQWLVPLLILPQLTHYIIDGFIWKVSKGHIPEKK
jgi:hypothetical protein